MRSVRNCSVSIVGGAGFLGSHIVNHLCDDRACDVLVIDNLVVGRREFVNPKARFVHHDITGSEDYLRNLFVEHKTRFVLNYAARPYVPDSFDRPLRTFDVNAVGAMKVINAAQEAGCEGILQISSGELYGGGQFGCIDSQSRAEREGEWKEKIDEMGAVVPHSTYGTAKAAIDYFVQTRWREAKTPCIALRQFNCVGPNETHPYVVPEIISQLAKQTDDAVCKKCHTVRNMANPPCIRCGGTFIDPDYQAVVHLGNNSFRDFLYAGDQSRMAVELLEKGQFGDVYNLGSETGIKIYDLAKLIGKLMGFNEVVVQEDASRKRPWEIWYLKSDNSKIYSVIESRPQVPLEEALRRTIQSYCDNGSKWAWEA